VRAEWDAAKEAVNFRKHGIAFASALSVFDDDLRSRYRTTCPARSASSRWDWTLSWRGDKARIISARKATRRERQQYEGHR